jgi:hypothetical protein
MKARKNAIYMYRHEFQDVFNVHKSEKILKNKLKENSNENIFENNRLARGVAHVRHNKSKYFFGLSCCTLFIHTQI